jgi:hypothetical protein
MTRTASRLLPFDQQARIAMQNIKTHYEQIPVAAVKQLLKKVVPIDDKHVVDDWRVLARRAQNEPDNDKMIELIQQVIVKFNEEKVRTRSAERARDRAASRISRM